MSKSMTGYGKAEQLFNNKQIVVEVRSVNSKALDVNLKLPIIYREKESEIRGQLTRVVQRGKVDVYITVEVQSGKAATEINTGIFKSYMEQLDTILDDMSIIPDRAQLINAVLRMPDVLKLPMEEINENEWQVVMDCFMHALLAFDAFRQEEGQIIMNDILQHITVIEQLLQQVEVYEPYRLDTVRQRIMTGLENIQGVDYDKNRFEQEMIYFIEKFDITEEKVRLKQHCCYFQETTKEEAPGRKLSFIAQEIGREINTLGSKANHADIQKVVVQMKDELEKVKEQLLNVL
jgi:uncharacterized protein (TIGR00255 family)